MRPLIALCCALILPACKRDAPSAPEPGAADTACVFRFALPEPPGSVDPAFARSSIENLVSPNLFEGLYNYPEADGPPVPGWSKSDRDAQRRRR